MKVFVTGVAGFIGSHVVRRLLSAGCEVLAFERPNVSLWRLHDILNRLSLLRGDLLETPIWQPTLSEWKPDACIHLAWYAEPGKYLYSSENIPSLTASLNLLKELIRIECQQVVMVGTCAEYDTDWGFLREDGPTRPVTIYAATKHSLNIIGQQMAASAGIQFAWARLFYLYGPYEDERRMAPALIRALLQSQVFPATQGEQVRDYLHVEDIASALWVLIQNGAKGTFNISSGIPVTIRQVMETVGGLLGRTDLIQFGALPYRDWEPMFICGDCRRLRAIGWAPQYSLKKGLQHTIDWWRHRE